MDDSSDDLFSADNSWESLSQVTIDESKIFLHL